MIGTRLGQYRIDALLGQGGMGAVYLATDEMLGRQVAIKVLRDDVDVQGTATERFRSEAQILSRLDHPCILRLYGFSQHEGVLYMVTEYVKGEALQRRLERGATIDPPQVVAWASQVLDALDYAHQLGVVHRDIKPANILIDDRNRARLLDFGIARIVGTDGPTQTGHAVGTLTYMAPEQVLDEAIDGRADLYAFAVVLCQMFAGRRPYRSTTTAGLIREIVDGPPPDVAALLPSQAAAFAPTLAHALARYPADRTPSAAVMRDQLIAAAAETPPSPAVPAPIVRESPQAAPPLVQVAGAGMPYGLGGVTPPRSPGPITTATDRTLGVPPAKRPVAMALVVPALLLIAAALGAGWYAVGRNRTATPAATAPSTTSATPAQASSPSSDTSVAPAPPAMTPAPASAPLVEAPVTTTVPAPRMTRNLPPRTSSAPAGPIDAAPPPEAAPIPAPAPIVEATPPPEPVSPPAAASVPATIEFKDMILMDRVDDEDEEIDVSVRLDDRRVMVLDEDGIAKRSIAYDAIARATYNSRRPGRFSLRRSSSHWLTLEVGTTPIVLRLNGRTFEQVLTTLQGHGVPVVRQP
jgi:serine/threonine protein kinase